MNRRLGENTRAVHLPPPPAPAQEPLGTPVRRTAAFAFRAAEEYSDVLNDRVPGDTYSRIDNPMVDAFAGSVAAFEGANLRAEHNGLRGHAHPPPGGPLDRPWAATAPGA